MLQKRFYILATIKKELETLAKKLISVIAVIFIILTAGSMNNNRVQDQPNSNFTPDKDENHSTLLSPPYFKQLMSVTELLVKVEGKQKNGEFETAKKLITDYLTKFKSSISEMELKLLNDEIERNRRIPLGYKLDENSLFNELSKSIKGLNKSEFDRWLMEGRFDFRIINSRKMFMNSSRSNLFFRYPELNARRVDYNRNLNFANEVYTAVNSIKNGKASSDGVVRLPMKTQISHSLTLNNGIVNKGDKLSCWLPYPISLESQNDIKLISTSYPVKSMDNEKSSIRSAYFEVTATSSKPLPFEIVYSYTAYSYYRKVDPLNVGKYDVESELYKKYTAEDQHISFSNEITSLAKKITGNETNPYKKAYKIYNWICDNIKYSYAVEYSTIRNISEYTMERGYGDCGQQTLLFMSLCRSEGIPARWQSGFTTYKSRQFIHDWAEIYIDPYGWIPVDTYMGVYFTSVSDALDSKKSKEIRDFYFGNMDYFRMVANIGHCQQLKPWKKYLRADTVDFQRGEIESDSRNFYFDEWKYKIKVNSMPL